jgi:carbonic anhydrase
MAQIVYRSDPNRRGARRHPRDAEEALAWLNKGNRRFASVDTIDRATEHEAYLSLVIEADLGTGSIPEQRPFGIVLGCADARVPIELVFGRAVNDLFVVRVAGNTIGSDGIGSIAYAVHHFSSVKIAVVLGHSACGAVGAAVDAFRNPSEFLDLASSLPLRSLVDRIMASVRASANALSVVHGEGVVRRPGYATVLRGLSVGMNAAYTAYCLGVELARAGGQGIPVVWGIYDLATRRVSIPGAAAPGLGAPPADAEGFRALARALASSPRVTDILRDGETKE